MRIAQPRLAALVLAVVALVASLAATSAAQGNSNSGGEGQIISALGVSKSRPGLVVDVVVFVPSGQSTAEAAAAALASQNARPISPAYLGSTGFELLDHSWPGATATQTYNPADAPDWVDDPEGDDYSWLDDAQLAWSLVQGSNFSVGTVDENSLVATCPSLVPECPGDQDYDGENTVKWVALKGNPNVLGVAWSSPDNGFGTGTPESDIALNSKFNWLRYTDYVGMAQATMLHEEGHFAGIGHSADSSAVMYASISASNPQIALKQDDKEAVRFKYPTTTVTVSGTVSANPSGSVAGAEVTLAGTSHKVDVDASGSYLIPGVPKDVTYDVVATLGSDSETVRKLVNANIMLDLVIAVSGGEEEEGGSGPPWCANPVNSGHPACNK